MPTCVGALRSTFSPCCYVTVSDDYQSGVRKLKFMHSAACADPDDGWNSWTQAATRLLPAGCSDADACTPALRPLPYESQAFAALALLPPTVLREECRVLVVGGGTAGTIAAIQSGRAGARTLLLERNGQLGGTTTTGGVAFPGLFDAWGRQVIAGIGWELVRDSVELDQGPMPDFSKVPKRHWQNQVYVNQFLYAILAEEKCAKAGVEIAYHDRAWLLRFLLGHADVVRAADPELSAEVARRAGEGLEAYSAEPGETSGTES